MKTELSEAEVTAFIENGFVRIDNVFSKDVAAAARAILWRDLDCDPDDPTTWTKPVVRLQGYADEPFRVAVNAPILLRAFDQLVGKRQWQPRNSLGGFPIRFPGDSDPGDTGWHNDASFAGDDGSWRLNINSKDRALLMLFLFSDVGERDAPTRILVGSHLDVPPLLLPYGEAGLSFMELAAMFKPESLSRKMVLATGQAGTVYLCHPFLIHAAQRHTGTMPRFLAQPPLIGEVMYDRADKQYTPVEQAIRVGLGL